MKLPLSAAVGLAALGAFAASPQPSFEAADVHISLPGATPGGGFLTNGRVEFRATALLQLIASAWGVTADRIAGGPAWIDDDRFDVVAQASPKTSRIASRTMLRTLLTERFGLSIASVDKPVPVFALMAGKSGSGTEAAPGEQSCTTSVDAGLVTLSCRNTTISELANVLARVAPAYFTRPVVDRTNRTGAYDFRLQWSGRDRLPAGPAGLKDSRSLFSVLEKELGLKVDEQTAPVAFLTVTHADRTPAPNPAGTAEKLGPPPREFDAADLRPSQSGATPDLKVTNGQIVAKGIPLRNLIAYAFNAEDDQLKGGERWLSTTQFDLVAKTAPTASPDTVRVMLQALLKERFGLKVHNEQTPISVFALTAEKPGLKDADPAERTSCKAAQVNYQIVYTCTNVTMARFVEKIHDVATGYLDRPVVDLTGLNGSYDFTLTWSPLNRTRNASAEDPNGELTVFEAVTQQLGLKFTKQKYPMPVTVIDHVERNVDR